MSQPLNYRIVFTFTNGAYEPVTLKTELEDRDTALKAWRLCVRSGGYAATSGNRCRVMSEPERLKAGIR